MPTSIIYLDHMASTPVAPEVRQAINEVLSDPTCQGNPSSVHDHGMAAKALVDKARTQVANAIHATPDSLIWTSGATESINIALQGAARAYQRQGRHIITLRTEHKAVLAVCAQLEKEGFKISYLTPKSDGLVDIDTLKNAFQPDTILVSVCHINNELGVIQPISSMASLAHQHGAMLHVDAAQSIGKTPVDVQAWGADLVSFSAHKAYGPKGIGALYINQHPKRRLQPILYGGGQEQHLRPGTLATHQIVGMGRAFELATIDVATNNQLIDTLHSTFWDALNDQLPHIHLHGSKTHSVPHVLNIAFDGVDGESLQYALQTRLAVSSGSACNAATLEPSHVLTAIGLTRAQADSSIRFSLGRDLTTEAVHAAAQHVITAVQKLRQQSPLWNRSHGSST